MNKWLNNLTWIIPLIGFFVGFGYNMYRLSEKVDNLELKQGTVGLEYVKKVDELNYRLNRVEEFCCAEIKECTN